MTTRRFALEPGSRSRLEARWRWRLRDLSLTLDGVALPLPPAGLEAGVSVALPEGGALWVQVVRRKWWSVETRDKLRLECGGAPVPGSDFHPRVIGRRAAALMGFLGLLDVLFLLLVFTFSRAPAAGPIGLEGLLLLVLAGLAAWGRRLPVLLGAALMAVDTAVPLILTANVPPAALVLRTLLVVFLVQSWRRMKAPPATAGLAKVFE